MHIHGVKPANITGSGTTLWQKTLLGFEMISLLKSVMVHCHTRKWITQGYLPRIHESSQSCKVNKCGNPKLLVVNRNIKNGDFH